MLVILEDQSKPQKWCAIAAILAMSFWAQAQHLVCQPWQIENPQPAANNAWAIAQGGGHLLVVGDRFIMTSSDGGDSFTPIFPGPYWFRDVLWNGSMFITCTESGEIFTSADGLVWDLRVADPIAKFRSLAQNGERVVVVGSLKVGASLNGIDWQFEDTLLGGFNEIYWNGTFFITVGTEVNHLVSVDGLNWTQTFLGIGDSFNSFAYNKVSSSYVALGDLMSYRSNSGTGWVSFQNLAGNPKLVRVANGYFFMLRSQKIYRSPDGENWEMVFEPPIATSGLDILWTGTRYLMICFNNLIYESPDGKSWSLANAFLDAWLHEVHWDGQQFILFSGTDTLWTSPDGSEWQETALPQNELSSVYFRDVAQGPQGIFAVGFSDTMLFSADGQDWSFRDNGLGVSFGSIDWLNGAWYAAALDGSLYRSTDGMNWTGFDFTPNGEDAGLPYELAYHDGIWVVAGYSSVHDGYLATSDDLQNWTFQIFGGVGRFYTVAWVGDRFMAGTLEGQVYQSPDGLKWELLDPPVERLVYQITYNGRDIFILDGRGNFLRTEDPDAGWLEDGGTLANLRSWAFGNDRMVAVGGSGSIFTRECGLCYYAEEVLNEASMWLQGNTLIDLVSMVNNPCE